MKYDLRGIYMFKNKTVRTKVKKNHCISVKGWIQQNTCNTLSTFKNNLLSEEKLNYNFRAEFACSPGACVGFLQVLRPCDWLATCPGCTPPLTQWQLGPAPAPCDPVKDKWYRWWMDGWMDGGWQFHKLTWHNEQLRSFWRSWNVWRLDKRERESQ